MKTKKDETTIAPAKPKRKASSVKKKALEGDLILKNSTVDMMNTEEMFPVVSSQRVDVLIEEKMLDRALARSTGSLIPIDDALTEITYEFKKNRGLIRSLGALSEVQRKVMNILIWNALPELDTRQMHKIRIVDIISLMGSDKSVGGSYRGYLIDVLQVLKNIQINLHYDSEGRENDVTQTGILSDFQYRGSDGLVIYGFSKITNALIADASYAAQIDLRMQASIEGRHSISLWETALSYLAEGVTPMWPVEIWRRDLGVLNSSTYADYRFFKSKILKPAMEEVLKVGKIRLTQVEKTLGRKVVAFCLQIERLSSNEMGVLDAIEIRNSPAFKALKHIGVTNALAAEAVIRDPLHASEVAAEAERQFRAGVVKNPGAWAAKMLREYIQVKSGIQRELEKQQELENKAARVSAKKEVAIKQIGVEKKQFQKRMVDEYLNNLSEAEVVNMAGAATMKSYGFPTKKNELSAVIREGLRPDGSFDKEQLDKIIKNQYFRGHVLGIIDPGFTKSDQYLLEKFGAEAFGRYKLI